MPGCLSSRLSVLARRALVGALAAVGLLAAWALPGAATAQAQASRHGQLVVTVGGLPAGQPPAGLLRGPGVRRMVRGRRVVLRGARPGRYTLRLSRVRLRRASGPFDRGAVASPARRRVSVRVGAGRRARLRARYASIVNPVTRFDGRVAAVQGPSGNPSKVVLHGRHRLARGDLLSIPPGPWLPRGLLSRVRQARRAGDRTTVAVEPASPYEVAPVFEFDVPLTADSQARAAATGCGVSSASGVNPYRRIDNIRFSGGWNTRRLFGQDVKLGVRAMVGFDVHAGLEVARGAGVSCSTSASVSASGMAGPIPVTAAIEGELTASADVGAKLRTGGSVHVQAGASTVGTPPALVWLPEVRFSNPRFDLKAEAMARATAGIGVGVKAGIGNDHVASATIRVGSTVEGTVRPGACSWDARLGEFSAGGKVLGWTISTPSTPPLYTRNLWRAACGGPASSGGAPGVGASAGSTPGQASAGGGGGDEEGGGGASEPPEVQVSLLSPDTGPLGYRPAVRLPPCDAPEPVYLVKRDGASWTYLRFGDGDEVRREGHVWVMSLYDGTRDPRLLAGTHRFAFECQDSNTDEVIWRAPGFDLTLTGLPRKVSVSSNQVPAGGSVEYITGASNGAEPCPSIQGLAPTGVGLWGQVVNRDTSGNSIRYVELPSASSSLSMPLRPDVYAGDRLEAWAICGYDVADGVGANFEFLEPAEITVTE